MESAVNKGGALFLRLVGGVLASTKLSGYEDIVWAPMLFSVLKQLSDEGVYQLFLLKEKSDVPEPLYQRILDTLSDQGIMIGGLVTTPEEVPSLEIPLCAILGSETESIASSKLKRVLPVDHWPTVLDMLGVKTSTPHRRAKIQRETRETRIELSLDLDGSGKADIHTGLPFFDHMLHQVARHGRLDLSLHCEGDLEVDEHHSVEDVAIVLGQALARALGEKRGISRYGFEVLPMDECLAQVAIDFSGRAWFVWDVLFGREMVGSFPTELFSHFFKSLSDEARCNLHMRVGDGNAHHQAEALFKAFGRAVRRAVFRYPGSDELPSTKGVL